MRKIALEQVHAAILAIMVDIDRFCREQGIRYSLAGGTLLGAVRHQGFIPWDDDADIVMPRADYERFIATYNTDRNTPYRCICEEQSEEVYYVREYAKVHDPRTQCREASGDAHVQYGIFVDIFPLDGFPDGEAEAIHHLNKCHALRRKLYRSNVFLLEHKRFLLVPKYLLAHLHAPHYWRERCEQEMRRYDFDKANFVGVVTGRYRLKERMPRRYFEAYTELPFEGHSFSCIAAWNDYLTHLYGNYMQLPPEPQRETHAVEAYWVE